MTYPILSNLAQAAGGGAIVAAVFFILRAVAKVALDRYDRSQAAQAQDHVQGH
jgi:hypothetical protein